MKKPVPSALLQLLQSLKMKTVATGPSSPRESESVTAVIDVRFRGTETPL